MEMANYILQILKMANIMVFFSWGADKFQSLSGKVDGLRMRVNGFKHKGWVRIEYDDVSDYFVVILESGGTLNKFGNELTRVPDVDLESLQGIVDELVEHTDNYEQDVNNYLS